MARTCTAMLAQIIATIAYAGPRWRRENRVTVVYKSETRSLVPSSVATIARTTMPGIDLEPTTMRLKVRVTTLPSAILPKPKPLTRWQKFAAEKVTIAPLEVRTPVRRASRCVFAGYQQEEEGEDGVGPRV